MKKLLVAGAALAMLASAGAASAVVYPGYGADAGGPSLIITLNAGGTVTLTGTGQPATYDGGGFGDDTYIGVENHSGHTVGHISISSTQNIFGFDGDGLTAFGAPGNVNDPSGYGGPNAWYTNIVFGATETGDVNFIGGIKDGGSSYFALEAAVNAASFPGGSITGGGVPEPTTWAMMLMGFFGMGALMRRRQGAIA